MLSKMSVPCLHDSHSHFTLYAGMFKSVCLKDVKTKEEALNLFKKFEDGKLNSAYGWNSGFYSFEKSELNKFPPLIISNLSLHGFVMNEGAEKLLRPDFTEIIDNYENPGWCEEHVTELLLFFVQILPSTIETMQEFAGFLLKECGVYEIEDMLLPTQEIFETIDSSALKNRVSFWADINTFRKLPDPTKKRIRGIKLFTDGANGSATAALSRPYQNGNKGVLTHSLPELVELLEEAASTANGVAIHALGDIAAKQVVDAAEIVRKHGSSQFIRLEHAQFIDLETAKRAKNLGIVLSMQPNFTEDSLIYADRLPDGFAEKNNPFRMLIDKAGFVPGKDMFFGSDGMPHGVKFALQQSLRPVFEGQRLTLSEFVAGYCVDEKLGSYEFDPTEIFG
ncbi:amidohydrolase family protein [bacterium]|jgi:predicted amidohydrolase YtcJ|nr:amidohydrolase family protein [bacterium]